jgi:tRNA pseudouridine13 synthase
MKVKQTPDDFCVEELTDIHPGATGSFALYRLEKRGWTTPDALQAIRRRWKIDLRRLSAGGLKDRHAHTVQYLTIHHGPERRLTHQGIRLDYLGKVAAPYSSRDIRGNRFQLVLRSLGESDLEHAAAALPEVERDGVPNYFDDQRFGSVSSGEFVAKALVLGDFEKALRLALAAPYEYDRAAQKQEKALLNAHWGDWQALKEKLPRSHARSLVDYLVHHPSDFRGAVARLRPELRGLYLSAYQSFLWNRIMAAWLRLHVRPEHLVSVALRLGEVPMHRGLSDEQREALHRLELPLPTARGTADPADPRTALMEAVLAEEGIKRDQLKLKGLREMFFSRGERAALCLPAELTSESGEDELNVGRRKLQLGFTLPRGCYATLVVKRVMIEPQRHRDTEKTKDRVKDS